MHPNDYRDGVAPHGQGGFATRPSRVLLACLLCLSFFLLPAWRTNHTASLIEEKRAENPAAPTPAYRKSGKALPVAFSTKTAPEAAPAAPQFLAPVRFVEGKMPKNITFSDLLKKEGVETQTIQQMADSIKPVFNLRRLRQGQPYKIGFTGDNTPVLFDYQVSNQEQLKTAKEGEEFKSQLVQVDLETRIEVVQGAIQNNLISSLLNAGGTYQLAADFVDIFSWDIDFFKDLRAGDEFKLLVENYYHQGQFVENGQILAASFNNNGKTVEAVYFDDGYGNEGYYAPDGKPVKKQFLKTPLKFTRIASGFSLSRFHPIYKTYLPHLGIDYAAPMGTPVLAIADGSVAAVTNNPRAGNFITLRHFNEYTSTYNHLIRFADNVAPGAKVRQGQVIGYVGATGAATGPHLCFHLKKHGQSVNPLTFKSPGGPALARQHQGAFAQTALQRLRILESSAIAAAPSKRPVF